MWSKLFCQIGSGIYICRKSEWSCTHVLYVAGSDQVFLSLPQILANGLFLNPNAAIRSLWDALDWLIVLATLATMITYLVLCDPHPIQVWIQYIWTHLRHCELAWEQGYTWTCLVYSWYAIHISSALLHFSLSLDPVACIQQFCLNPLPTP